MLQITYNNIVMPVSDEYMGIKITSAVEHVEFNYNTYVMLSPLAKNLIVSSVRPTSRYNADGEEFYFIYAENGINIKVPLEVLFNTNDKIGIPALSFSTAKNCPSRSRGYCQLDNTELCYARRGELQASAGEFKYLNGMDSLKNGELCIYYWNLFLNDAEVRRRLVEYIELKGYEKIRFNLKGDFKNADDIRALIYLINNTNAQFYGYTARDDLNINSIGEVGGVVNGSNKMYGNRFLVTDSLYIYLNSPYSCWGECLKCGNCYKARGVNIIALIHGAGADTKLKTNYNIKYLVELLNAEGLNIKAEELEAIKLGGLLSSLNKWLEAHGYNTFKGKGSARAFRQYLKVIHKKHMRAKNV